MFLCFCKIVHESRSSLDSTPGRYNYTMHRCRKFKGVLETPLNLLKDQQARFYHGDKSNARGTHIKAFCQEEGVFLNSEMK